MSDDDREKRAEILNNDELSAGEKVDEIRNLDAPEESNLVGDTIEGAAHGLASLLTLGAIDALPGDDKDKG